jgi:hypothetical protein
MWCSSEKIIIISKSQFCFNLGVIHRQSGGFADWHPVRVCPIQISAGALVLLRVFHYFAPLL